MIRHSPLRSVSVRTDSSSESASPLNSLATKIFSLGAVLALGGCKWALMDPKGTIGDSEKSLIETSFFLMLLVVVPVIVMTIVFAIKYRAGNEKAEYKPEWGHSNKIEMIVWGVPCAIVLALSILCWKSTHTLDPRNPLTSNVTPIEIDVVAMNWKWLFIYPEQHVASVNQVAFPVDTPVHFVITSDSVMNSFFIPQIGSQIYAMTGMKANLNLMANEVGTYHGLSANFSGPGFSGMGFDAKALPSADFSNWVATAAQSSDILDATTYPALKEPSEDVPVHYYSQVADGLFDGIVDSYMGMAMDKSEKTKADSEKGAE